MKYKVALFLLISVWLTGCDSETSRTKNVSTGPVKVSMIIDFEGDSDNLNIKDLEITGQSSVRELLILASDKQLLTFSDTLYSGMGHLLLSINQMEPSGSEYWFYCVNGKKANKGIDDFRLNDGDVIKWTLTADSDPCK
ncbi:MAG: DUF4430 domain-containing protein [Cyclobacteriaceae bacterium]